ncbi:MAG: hypothetical protein NT090_05640 [Acidobacteria bacterium]|nr:hypothetical protein [Acidobacteriota bacterium]
MTCRFASWAALVLSIAALLALHGSTSLPAANQPQDWRVLFVDNFEDESSERWDLSQAKGSAGSWKVEIEEGNCVLSGTGFSWVTLRAQEGRWANFRFRARVKVIQGTILLNYRFASAGTYFLAFQPTGLRLVRAQAPDGDVDLVRYAESQVLGRWYDVEIVGIGGNIKVYVDGTLKMNYTDTMPITSGTIGFEAPGDSHVHVDDVEISGPASLEGAVWVKTGGPIGGIGYDVKMRPDNPDIMFVTDTFSGVNVSKDGGKTWAASNQGILNRAGASGDAIPVFCLTVDPNRPDTVWIGTQNKRGVYRSSDGGASWVAKVQGIVEQQGITFRGFTVDPSDSNTVYAAGELSSIAWAGKTMVGRSGLDVTKGVVYKTTDGGGSWTAIWRGDSLARYVWIDPRDSNVLYVSTGIFDREAANVDVERGFFGGVGILKSTDGGRNWTALGQANGLASLYIGSLFLHPQDPDTLLAGAGGPGSILGPDTTDPAMGVYLSRDGGSHWQRAFGFEDRKGRVEQVTAVEFAVSDPDVAYAAGPQTFWRSTDGGRTWAARSGGPPDMWWGLPGTKVGFPIDLQVDPRNADRVFVNSYGGGNFLSDDGGRTWSNASDGYTGANLHDIALRSDNYRAVYTIGRSGIFRSRNGGGTWTGLNREPATFSEWYAVAVAPGDAGVLLIADEHQGTLFRSTDDGDKWQLVFRHPEVDASDPNRRHGFKALAFAPSNPSTIYAGMCRERTAVDQGRAGPSFGVYKSTDGGVTWHPANDARTAEQNINVLVVDPRSESVVHAGTVKGGILRTLDGGRSWETLNRGLPIMDARALAVDPGNWMVFYAGLERGGIWKSMDAGGTWQPAGAGMEPQASVRDIAIDPTDSRVVYAGDLRSGIYRSEDGGKLWVQINKGLRTRAVKALALSSDGGTLYAATDGEGVFRLDIKPFER